MLSLAHYHWFEGLSQIALVAFRFVSSVLKKKKANINKNGGACFEWDEIKWESQVWCENLNPMIGHSTPKIGS